MKLKKGLKSALKKSTGLKSLGSFHNSSNFATHTLPHASKDFQNVQCCHTWLLCYNFLKPFQCLGQSYLLTPARFTTKLHSPSHSNIRRLLPAHLQALLT